MGKLAFDWRLHESHGALANGSKNAGNSLAGSILPGGKRGTKFSILENCLKWEMQVCKVFDKVTDCTT